MPQTLAQMVRAKYPHDYDDLSDVELEQKVKTKFPGEYDDLPTSQAESSEKSTIGSLWEKANAPLLPFIHRAANAVADYIDQPRVDRSQLSAQVHGFLAGATQGAGQLIEGMTSPVGLALTALNVGPESAAAKAIPGAEAALRLPAVQALKSAATKLAGLGYTAHGASQALTAPTLAGKAAGVAEAAAGAIGTVPSGRLGPIRNKVPENAAAVEAGLAAGVPLDVATATGNKFVRGVQRLADESAMGSVVSEPAQQRTQAGMADWGQRLAEQVKAGTVRPDEAGEAIRKALQAKQATHGQEANVAYERLRSMEAESTNRMAMPLQKKAPIDAIPEPIVGQLRRIVHELDAAPYTPRILQPAAKSGDLVHVAGTGGAGAKVYDDILERMSSGSNPTRGTIQTQLEHYLAGGPETSIIRAAREVAELRGKAQGGRAVSKPELGPDVMNIPTAREGSRVTSEDMGLPVILTDVKEALKPVYDQMKRQMPITQQMANPGLKAMENLLTGPDYAPLSQVDRDLSTIKGIARTQGGLAKLAVQKLNSAVEDAAGAGGPEVSETLQAGRQATRAKYAAQAVEKALPSPKLQEPVAVLRAVTKPHDGGIAMLRAVSKQVPEQVPTLARARVDELLGMKPDKAFAEWIKMGPQTKAMLYPDESHRQELQNFFRLAKNLAENPNPSGSALTIWKGGELTALVTSPHTGIPYSLGIGGLAKLLHSPTGVRLVTRGIQMPKNNPAAAALVAKIIDSAESKEQ